MISQYFYIDCIRDDTEFHTAVVLFEQSNCVGCIFIFAVDKKYQKGQSWDN
jgi:hypothetical protein